MSFDFSFLAQINRTVAPLESKCAGRRGPSEQTIKRVHKCLHNKRYQSVAEIAPQLEISIAAVRGCLAILKKRGQARPAEKLGPSGMKIWVKC